VIPDAIDPDPGGVGAGGALEAGGGKSIGMISTTGGGIAGGAGAGFVTEVLAGAFFRAVGAAISLAFAGAVGCSAGAPRE
jgi:hypothetical protein